MILKFFITIITGICMLIAGYYTYIFLHRKIRESTGVPVILGYSILLFTALGILYFGGLYAMAKVYEYLSATK